MNRTKVIRSLLLKAVKMDGQYVSKIKSELDRTERIYRNTVPKEEFMKFYDLLINEITSRNLVYQSMEKELRNDYLDKGEANE